MKKLTIALLALLAAPLAADDPAVRADIKAALEEAAFGVEPVYVEPIWNADTPKAQKASGLCTIAHVFGMALVDGAVQGGRHPVDGRPVQELRDYSPLIDAAGDWAIPATGLIGYGVHRLARWASKSKRWPGALKLNAGAQCTAALANVVQAVRAYKDRPGSPCVPQDFAGERTVCLGRFGEPVPVGD